MFYVDYYCDDSEGQETAGPFETFEEAESYAIDAGFLDFDIVKE